MQQVPEPVRNIGVQNPLVHNLIQQFARGQIITKEECLCQIIIGLSRDWDSLNKQHLDFIMQSTQPMMAR